MRNEILQLVTSFFLPCCHLLIPYYVAEHNCGPAGGFSGAELANVVNEAALLAGRQGQDYITLAELVEAVQRTKYGVNGGRSMLVPTQGLQRRLTDWVIKRLSSNKQVKAQPVGH